MLARWDRPIGTWLLVIPCWWGQVLATSMPNIFLSVMFFVGAFAMRGAGCTINDIVDRDFDRNVERTRNRPLAAGRLRISEALLFTAAQMLAGLIVLTQLPTTAQIVALASVPLILVYPFMKRLTYWPQAFLGLTFNWGILVGYATESGQLSLGALLLYAAAVLWTLGYDTIYAHQDKEDDVLVGVKSLALWLGDRTKRWLWGFFGMMIAGILLAGIASGKSLLIIVPLAPVALLLGRQVQTLQLNSAQECLTAFRFHRVIGLMVLVALWIGSFSL